MFGMRTLFSRAAEIEDSRVGRKNFNFMRIINAIRDIPFAAADSALSRIGWGHERRPYATEQTSIGQLGGVTSPTHDRRRDRTPYGGLHLALKASIVYYSIR